MVNDELFNISVQKGNKDIRRVKINLPVCPKILI